MTDHYTPLSPAAQAVLRAYELTADAAADSDDCNALAAALRAAADQCINRKWSVEMDELYREFYAIAAELDGGAQ